jgi:diguanylate cyclase (GGDEF)-like protein/hemerythrin-like metal-binding protein/PAS domain S-box-containing protein
MLLNPQGYWLLAPDPADAWGFMFGRDAATATLAGRQPLEWASIAAAPSGQFLSASGLWSWTTVDPASVLPGDIHALEKWTLVSHLSATEVTQLQWQQWQPLLAIALLALGSRLYVKVLIEKDIADLELANAGARRLADERLRLAIDGARLGTSHRDLVTDEVTCSATFYEIFGLTAGTPFDHKAALAAIHADDRQRVDDTIKQAIATLGGCTFEFRIVWPDGSLHWIDATFQVYANDNGQPMSLEAVVSDISERKEQELALQQTLELLSLAKRAAGAGAWSWDMVADRLRWSERVFRLFGLDPSTSEASLSTWRAALHPDDLQSAENCMRAAIRERQPFATTYRVLLPAGEIRWIDAYGQVSYDASGTPLRFDGLCIDASARKHAEQQLRDSERRFRNLFVYLPVAYQSLDSEGRWLDANQNMADLLGFETPEEMFGLYFSDFVDEQSTGHFAAPKGEFKAVHSVAGELTLKRRDDRCISVLRSDTVQRDARGELLRTHGIVIDISERRAMEEKIRQLNTGLEAKVATRTAELALANEELHHLARHDALTGLPNRRVLHEHLRRALATGKRSGHLGALLLLDLDNFKPLNDEHGHAVGDLLLIEVARRLGTSVRELDTVVRFGGDEFVVLLDGLNSDALLAREEAASVAEKIRRALAQPYLLALSPPAAAAGVEHRCTASIGVTIFSHRDSDADDILRRADAAMYQAKAGGRNAVVFAPDSGPLTGAGEGAAANFVHLAWCAAYECGNALIDGQHRQLVNTANKLLNAIVSSRPDDEVATLIDSLLREVVSHFNDEEAIIAAAGFPQSAEHAAIHRQIVDRASVLVARFHSGTLDVGELFKFLATDVIAKHILSADRQYFPYLEGQN